MLLRRFARSNWFLTVTALALTVGLLMSTDGGRACRVQAADGNLASDFCYVVAISSTYSGALPLTNTTVRVPFNVAGLIAAEQMDNGLWDVHPTNTSFVESDALAQDISSATAPVWVLVPAATTGQTIVTNLYFGAADLQRDQGLLFTSADSHTAAHHADYNITDNLTLSTIVEYLPTSPVGQNSTLASHWAGGAGYRLLFVSSGGLMLRGQVDAQTCDAGPLTTADDNENLQMVMQFTAPNLTVSITDDDGTVRYTTTCNTGLGAISTVSTPFVVGTSLTSTIIRDVRLLAVADVRVHYGYNPSAMTELTALNPTYTGSILDESGNSHTATYTFTRAQTDWTVSVGPVQLVSAPVPPALPGGAVNILGDNQFGRNIGLTPVPENTGGMIFTFFDPAADAFSGPRDLFWALILVAFAIAILIVVYMLFSYIPIAVLFAGIPLVYGVTQGYIQAWVLFIWALFTIASWFAVRRGETT